MQFVINNSEILYVLLCKVREGHAQYFTSAKLCNYFSVSKLFISLR